MYLGNSVLKGPTKTLSTVALSCILSFAFAAACQAQSSGSTTWVATFNTPGGAAPAAASTDAQGNVYVTGSAGVSSNSCQPPTSCTQAVTIEYGPSGKVLWRDWLSTTNPGSAQGMDVALDSAGNAYVLFAYTHGGTHPAGSSPLIPEVVVAKYNPVGGRDWINFIDSSESGAVTRTPIGMAVSQVGNVYVTYEQDGPNANTAAAVTIKYDTAGHTIWSRTINDAIGTNAQSRPTAIAIDAHENIYVEIHLDSATLQNDGEIIKFDSSGTRLASFGRGQISNANGFHVDLDGACYISGLAASPTSVPDDWIVAKFNPDQSLAYLVDITKLEGIAGTQSGVGVPGILGAITSDSAGNTFVLQRFDQTGPHGDGSVISVLKLDPSGHELFVTRYNQEPDESGRDVPKAMVVSPSGNVYITGGSAPEIPSGESGFVTIKYDNTGERQWVAQFTSLSQGVSASATAIALSADSVIVAGANFPSWVVFNYVP